MNISVLHQQFIKIMKIRSIFQLSRIKMNINQSLIFLLAKLVFSPEELATLKATDSHKKGNKPLDKSKCSTI